MEPQEYIKGLKEAATPDQSVLDEINKELILAKNEGDTDSVDFVTATACKICYMVLLPFAKVVKYLLANNYVISDVCEIIASNGGNQIYLRMSPSKIYDYLVKRKDDYEEILNANCNYNDYIALSNAISKKDKKLFVKRSIEKDRQLQKLAHYCSVHYYQEHNSPIFKDGKLNIETVEIIYGADFATAVNIFKEDSEQLAKDFSMDSTKQLYRSFFKILLSAISTLERKNLILEKDILTGVFYKPDDSDCLSIYKEILERFLQDKETLPEPLKPVIIQMPLADEVFPGKENGEEQIPLSKYSLPIDKFDRRTRSGKINEDYIGLSEEIEKRGVEKFTNLLNAIAQAGYINNDKKTIQTLCYRLSGYDKSGELETIEFHYINKGNDTSKVIKWPVKNIMYLIGAVTESKTLMNTGTNRYVIGLSYFNYEGKDNMQKEIKYQDKRNAEKAFKDIVDKYTK